MLFLALVSGKVLMDFTTSIEIFSVFIDHFVYTRGFNPLEGTYLLI